MWIGFDAAICGAFFSLSCFSFATCIILGFGDNGYGPVVLFTATLPIVDPLRSLGDSLVCIKVLDRDFCKTHSDDLTRSMVGEGISLVSIDNGSSLKLGSLLLAESGRNVPSS